MNFTLPFHFHVLHSVGYTNNGRLCVCVFVPVARPECRRERQTNVHVSNGIVYGVTASKIMLLKCTWQSTQMEILWLRKNDEFLMKKKISFVEFNNKKRFEKRIDDKNRPAFSTCKMAVSDWNAAARSILMKWKTFFTLSFNPLQIHKRKQEKAL